MGLGRRMGGSGSVLARVANSDVPVANESWTPHQQQTELRQVVLRGWEAQAQRAGPKGPMQSQISLQVDFTYPSGPSMVRSLPFPRFL